MKKLFILALTVFMFSATAQAENIVGVKGMRHRSTAHNQQHTAVIVDSAAPSGSVAVASTGGVTIPAGGLVVTAGGATITAGGLTVTAGTLKVPTATAPVSAAATGVAGEFRVAANGIYFCTATDTWVKVAMATW